MPFDPKRYCCSLNNECHICLKFAEEDELPHFLKRFLSLFTNIFTELFFATIIFDLLTKDIKAINVSTPASNVYFAELFIH